MADPNRALFESVVRLLAPVLDELVFLGGCTTGLFITDPAASGIRPTRDVDAIVDVASYAKYTALSLRVEVIQLTPYSLPVHATRGIRAAPLTSSFNCTGVPIASPVGARRLKYTRNSLPSALTHAAP